MPLETDHCESCGDAELVCPNCGDIMVTPMENYRSVSPDKIVTQGLETYVEDEDDHMWVESLSDPTVLVYSNICWQCPFEEEVTVTIERDRVDNEHATTDE